MPPLVVRSVLPTLCSIDPYLREVALPIVARAVLVGAVFTFTVSMGEVGATSLIACPERPTVPIAIYRFLGRPGAANYGQALAMSTLLMLARLIVAPFVKLSPRQLSNSPYRQASRFLV